MLYMSVFIFKVWRVDIPLKSRPNSSITYPERIIYVPRTEYTRQGM